MTTRRVAARRVEEEIANVEVHLVDSQAPLHEQVPLGGHVGWRNKGYFSKLDSSRIY